MKEKEKNDYPWNFSIYSTISTFYFVHFSWSTIIRISSIAHNTRLDIIFSFHAEEPEICAFALNIKILSFKMNKNQGYK
jgi:hypothetical protein